VDLERQGKITVRVIYVCCDCQQSQDESEGTTRWYGCRITNAIMDEYVAEHGFPSSCPLRDSH